MRKKQEEEQFQIALDMLKEGSEPSFISEVTGWSEEKVKRLKKYWEEQRKQNKKYYLNMFKKSISLFSKTFGCSKKEFRRLIKQREGRYFFHCPGFNT